MDGSLTSTKVSDPASSLWLHTASPATEFPTLTETIHTDIAVIGCGYTGLSTVLHLRQAGANVVGIDAHYPGFGASGRNNGQVVPAFTQHNPDDIIAQFGTERGDAYNRWVQENADLVFDLIERYAIACEAVRPGWMMPATSAAGLLRARSKFEQWQKYGYDVDWLDADQVQAETGSPIFKGAWLHRKGGNINPLGYARGLARAVHENGGVLYANSPAERVKREGSRFRIQTPTGSLYAERVVLATNAYANATLWPGLVESVFPHQLYQCATAPLSSNLNASVLPSRKSLTDAHRLVWACRKDEAGRLVTGTFPLFAINGASREFVVGSSIKLLEKIFPQLSGAITSQYVWSGMIAITTDRLPRFHELAEGVSAGMGYSGRGIAMATGMGKLLARHALGEAADTLPVPLAPFPRLRLPRFALALHRIALPWYRWLDRRDDAA